MALRHSPGLALGGAVALGLGSGPPPRPRPSSSAPLTLASGRVSIAGTSNIHAYTASTTTVRVTRVQVANGLTGPTSGTESSSRARSRRSRSPFPPRR